MSYMEKEKSKLRRLKKSVKLTGNKVGQTIKTKKNWSAPGPDLLANFWWKKVVVLRQDEARSFEATALCERDFPLWFSVGKTSFLPKPGEFAKDN